MKNPTAVGERPRAEASAHFPRWSWPGLPLGVLLLVALALRLWHLREGLPDFTDEAFPLRRGFDMAGWETGRIDWNPHAFQYPSLAFTMHVALQWLQYGIGRMVGFYATPADVFVAYHSDPTAIVITARVFGVACDLAWMGGAWVIAERLRRGAGPLAAAWLAFAPGLVLATRVVNVDAPLAALATWALERMLAYRASGRARDLALGTLLAGLAAGTKYSALLLAIPLVWSATPEVAPVEPASAARAGAPRRKRSEARPPRRPGLARALLSLAGTAAVFALTSPFLFLDFPHARFDLVRIANLVGVGQLGSFTGGARVLLNELTADLGWPGVVLAAVAPWVLARGGRAWAGLALYAFVFVLPPFLSRAPYPRYLLPALPALAAIASVAAVDVSARLRMPRVAKVAMVGLLLLPVAWAGTRAAATGRETTQALARHFIEGHIGRRALIVEEQYGAPLRSCPDSVRVTSAPAFELASAAWRRRYFERPTLHAVTLPLVVGGRGAVAVPNAVGGTRWLDVWANSSDLNQLFYHPALLAAADIVVTSDAVRGRYLADPARYGAALRCYLDLERHARLLADYRSGSGVTGPRLRIYRLTPELARVWRGAGLDPLWWVREVPARARLELERAAVGNAAEPDTSHPLSPRTAAGTPAPWVLALGAVFDAQVAPFAWSMAGHLAELGRLADAVPYAQAIVACSDPATPIAAHARSLISDALSVPPSLGNPTRPPSSNTARQ